MDFLRTSQAWWAPHRNCKRCGSCRSDHLCHPLLHIRSQGEKGEDGEVSRIVERWVSRGCDRYNSVRAPRESSYHIHWKFMCRVNHLHVCFASCRHGDCD